MHLPGHEDGARYVVPPLQRVGDSYAIQFGWLRNEVLRWDFVLVGDVQTGRALPERERELVGFDLANLSPRHRPGCEFAFALEPVLESGQAGLHVLEERAELGRNAVVRLAIAQRGNAFSLRGERFVH